MNALLIPNQRVLSSFSSYVGDPIHPASTSPIGYVFPNIDSDGDGLPDGLERMLGLNRYSNDSDGDGLSDDLEFPVSGVQPVGYDPLVP